MTATFSVYTVGPSSREHRVARKIARFGPRIPKDALPSRETHLSSRITDEFHDAFKGAPDGK